MKKLNYIFKIGLLLLVVLLVFLYAITFNSDLGWSMLLFFVMFSLLSLLSMSSSLKDIEISPLSPISTAVKEKQTILLEVKHREHKKKFFPVLIIKNEELNLNQTFVFFFKKEVILSFEWEPVERMHLDSLKFDIISTDIFGVFRKEKQQSIAVTIYVLPQNHLKNKAVLELINDELKQGVFGDVSFDLEKLRPYQSGDSMKQIDWKLSTKKQQLIYREYETHQRANSVFLFYGIRSFYYEKLLSIFFSLYQGANEPEYSFVLLSTSLPQNKKIELLDFAKIKRSEDPGEISGFKESHLIIFTPEMTGSLKKELAKIDSRKKVQVIDYKTIEGRLS